MVAGMTSDRSFDMTVDLPTRASRAAAAWGDLVEGVAKSWRWSAPREEESRGLMRTLMSVTFLPPKRGG
jgi:hypothetical protein